ncbi:MAG: hypothetical protein WA006_00455 [Rhodoglobus sp.]
MTEPSAPQRRRTRLLLVIGGIVLLLLVAAVVTLLVVTRPPAPQPQPTGTGSSPASSTPTPSPTATPAPTATAEPEPPSEADRLHFLESMQSGNTAALEQRFAETVEVTYAATECCGPMSAVDAVNALSYVQPGSGATWDFSLDEAELEQFRAGVYGPFFPVNALVGASSDGYYASFVPGVDGRIERILLSVFPPV